MPPNDSDSIVPDFQKLRFEILSGTKISQDMVELQLLMVFAVLTVPGYLLASFIKRCQDNLNLARGELCSKAKIYANVLAPTTTLADRD